MEVSLFFSSFTGSSFNFADNLPVVATFLTTVTRNLTTATHGRFIVAHVWRAQSVMTGICHGIRSTKRLATSHPQSGRRERGTLLWLNSPPPLYAVRDPIPGDVLSVYKVRSRQFLTDMHRG